MATTLANLNSRINDKRRDTSNDSVDMTTVGFRAINSGLEVWNIVHDFPWQEEKQIINYHEGIDTYTVNSDYKAPIDLRPQKGNKSTEFEMMSSNAFDSRQTVPYKFAMKPEAQVQYMKIKYFGTKSSIHTATDHDDNGTWTAGTGVANVTTDQYEFFDLTGSVKFDISASATGVISVTGFTAIDLSRFEDRSSVYFNIYLPTVTNLTSLQLKFGNDSSNYWTETVTSDYLGQSFVTGWNKVKINGWSTETGTPDASAVDFLELTITYSGSTTASAYRIENFFASEDTPLEFEYYSNNMTADVSNSNAKGQAFNDSAATSDTPLWSGQWDVANEPFIDTVLETIFFITGEYTDMSVLIEKARILTKPLRERYPSRRRYPLKQMMPDLNL